jgi:hypothetical protein
VQQSTVVPIARNHGDLARRVAAGHGNDGRPDGARALVRAQPAGEEAVAVCDLDDVVLARAGGGHRAGHALGPDLDVALGVPGHDGHAGGAGRALDAHDVFQRLRKEAVGELVAEVGLIGEGEELQIVDGPDVARLDALIDHALAVHGHVVVHPLDGGLQTFALQRVQRLAVHAFRFRIPDLHFSGFHLSETSS